MPCHVSRTKVTLATQERALLHGIATRGRHGSQRILNAVILLRGDEGLSQGQKSTNQEIADVLLVSMKKIDQVTRRFVEEGLDTALDKHTAKRQDPRKADGDFEAHLIALSGGKPARRPCPVVTPAARRPMVALQYIETISHKTVWRV